MKPRKFLLTVPSLLVLAAGASSEIIERVVAKVNGDIVTLSEFVNRQAAAVQAARVPSLLLRDRGGGFHLEARLRLRVPLGDGRLDRAEE